MMALINVRPQTVEAMTMSDFVIASFLYVSEINGPHGVKEGTFRNSSFMMNGFEGTTMEWKGEAREFNLSSLGAGSH